MATQGNAGSRLSKLYSSPLFSPFRTVDTEEELKTAHKARLKKNIEDEFTTDFQRWAVRSGPLPTIPRSLHSPKANSIRDSIAQREKQLSDLRSELQRLENATGIAKRQGDTASTLGEIQELTDSAKSIERENESYVGVIARLKLELASRKKNAESLTKVVKIADTALHVVRNKRISDDIEIGQINSKRNQAEKTLFSLQKERLDLLTDRLEETNTARTLTSQQKSDLLSKKMTEFERKQTLSALKAKVERVVEREKKTAEMRMYHSKLKEEQQAIRANFESFFATNDAETIISMFRREANRSEMLRNEVEEILLDQNKARKELEELAMLKERVAYDEDSQKVTTNKQESDAKSVEYQQKVKLIHLCVSSLSHIYKFTLEKDPNLELSPEISPNSSAIALISVIHKRLETAIQIVGQSQYLFQSTARFRPPRKRLTIKRQYQPDLREETFLKYTVLQGHFVLTPEGDTMRRRISTTIDSMLSSVASLLSQPNSYDRQGADTRRRRNWHTEVGCEDDTADKEEGGYWKEARRLRKETPRTGTATSSLPHSKSERTVRVKTMIARASEQRIDFSEVISDLQAATKHVRKLKTLSQRNWESQPAPSSPNSSKTKDTSEGFPLSPRLSRPRNV